MIRFTSVFVFLFCIVANQVFAQDSIFDCDNSKNFAKYLFNSNQYELAQHELERIGFFCEQDSVTQLMLLKSYRKLQLFNDVNLFFMGRNETDLNAMSPEFRLEYIRGLMIQEDFQLVRNRFAKGLNLDEEYEYQLGTSLLLMNWNEAYNLSQKSDNKVSFKLTGLRRIAEESYHAKRKKAWLATLMSALVPGSGKMYCGYWGDGVISFLFTASSSFFASRAFNKYGSDKVYPWLAGGLAISYYAGNIYGGNRAAIHYNEHINHEFIHETESILYSDY